MGWDCVKKMFRQVHLLRDSNFVLYFGLKHRYRPQSGTGAQGGGVPKEALLRNRVVKPGSQISNSFLSSLFMVSAPVDSI